MPFQKKLPLSAALRPGGQGVVNPKDVQTGEDTFDLGSIKGPKSRQGPKGPTQIGKGVTMPKQPRHPTGPKPPRAPQMPKIGKFR